MAYKVKYHVRSISLPFRSHPLGMTVEEQLNRIRSSEATSTPSASSASQNLRSLKDLYDCVDDFLQLLLTQQHLSHEHERNSAEELLDGSLSLLDVCGTAKEFFSHIKECIQELQSSFRRRKAGDRALADEVEAYIASQKKVQKVISKYLVNLRKMEKEACLNKNATLRMLREVEDTSLSMFVSLLSQMSVKSKQGGWSLVSKLLSLKRVSCDVEQGADEMADLEFELLSLRSGKGDNIQVSSALKRLETFESSIQDIEQDLACVYRRLVKMRVSLLNIVNH